LPYGSSEIPARIPEERLVEILKPSKGQSCNVQEEVRRLVESSSELREKAAGAKHICIALGASANAQALWVTARTLAQALIDTGVSPSCLGVLCTPEVGKLDPANFPDIAIDYHDPTSSVTDALNHFEGDFLPVVSSSFMKSDLKLVVGELKPHQFFGYSGLCDVVFPGLGGEASVQAQSSNRKGLEISDILKERLRIANTLENLYALGFVLDSELVIAEISLGSMNSCMRELRAKVDNICSCEVKRAADIVVISAGGAPADESLVRAVETFPSGLEVLKREGIMIVAAECAKGHGNGDFYRWCIEQKEPRHLEARLRHNFNYDGYKAAFLLRALANHRIYLISTVPDHHVHTVFGMRSAQTVNAALQTAQRAIGSDSTITVIPDAGRVSPKHLHTET
jgi:hypothetical protein